MYDLSDKMPLGATVMFDTSTSEICPPELRVGALAPIVELTMSTTHDGPMAANLLGRWEFPNHSGVIDAGLIDGIPQKDAAFGQARLCAGRFNTGSDRDAPVDLSEGTIAVQFTPDRNLGLSSDTLVSHGAFEQRSTKGFFEFRITYKGHIKVMHFANGENITLGTESDFFNPGDIVEATYCWSAAEGGTLLAENLSQGTSQTVYSATTGLTRTSEILTMWRSPLRRATTMMNSLTDRLIMSRSMISIFSTPVPVVLPRASMGTT